MSRRGKTGGLGRVRVGLIRFASQTGHGSKWVNQVASQSVCRSSQVASLVELTCIFQTSFFFFFLR